jgi:hypothetical protein
MGFVTVTDNVRSELKIGRTSCGCDCIVPLCIGFVLEVS